MELSQIESKEPQQLNTNVGSWIGSGTIRGISEKASGFFFFLRFYLFFRERGSEGERKEERYQSVASHMPTTRDLARNPGMDPDRNQTGDLLVCRLVLSPLSHTSQGRRLVEFK